MTHSHRRASSRHEYFRMDVPKDVRALVGKTSWQHSLRTSDPLAAASDRARWTAFYKDEVSRLRAQIKAAAKADTDQLIRRAFARLARLFNESLDDAVACQLRSLGMIVRSSWGLKQHRAMEAHHGIAPYDQPDEHEY